MGRDSTSDKRGDGEVNRGNQTAMWPVPMDIEDKTSPRARTPPWTKPAIYRAYLCSDDVAVGWLRRI